MYSMLNRDFSEILATVCLIESAEYVEIIGKPRGSDNVRDGLKFEKIFWKSLKNFSFTIGLSANKKLFDNFSDDTHHIIDIRCMNYY